MAGSQLRVQDRPVRAKCTAEAVATRGVLNASILARADRQLVTMGRRRLGARTTPVEVHDRVLLTEATPFVRVAAWRAVWGAQRANPVYGARYRHLTTRKANKLTATQAQTVIAAAILRHLHAVITTGNAWDPNIATHGTRHAAAELAA